MKNILLVEPDYKNKFPPLGLMKIATAHKLLGDNVVFVKGCDDLIITKKWDTIYITTLFTFYWKKTITTINYYKSKANTNNILIGGILASLLPEKIELETGIKPHIGPFKGNSDSIVQSIIQQNDTNLDELVPDIKMHGVDALPPDYSIFEDMQLPYNKVLDESYIYRTSQGCFRNCSFCAINTLTPGYREYINIKPIIRYIRSRWGEKRSLILMDDNILYSKKLNQVITDIKTLGFIENKKVGRKRIIVDYNQGVDLRLLNKEKLILLKEIGIRPLRIAFDDISLKEEYIKTVKLAIEIGFKEISSYLLYNYNDKPEDLYKRMEISLDLNDKYNSRIYSFPMKYIPTNSTERSFLSTNWTKRQIRSFRCILGATHGIVPVKKDFFYNAFGKDLQEFLLILQMPENYIIYRNKIESHQIVQGWINEFQKLTEKELCEVIESISEGKNSVMLYNSNQIISRFLLQHYKNEMVVL